MATCKFVPWFVFVLNIIAYADGYSSGAPNSRKVCTSLIPGHGAKQTGSSPAPYRLIVTDYDNQIVVSLVATSQVTFAGFIVQARDANNESKIIDGDFTESENTQPKKCQSSNMNTWTHNSGQTKTKVSSLWITPPYFNGSVVFTGTVVQVKQAYWDHIYSEPVYFLQGKLVNNEKFIANFHLLPNDQSSNDNSLQTIALNYDECQSKLCIGLAEISNCLSSKTCQALLTGTQNTQDESEFSIQAKLTGNPISKYYSAAFSEDNKMGDDFVIDCFVDSNGRANIGLSYNIGQTNEVIDSKDMLLEQKAQFENGFLKCQFKLKPIFGFRGRQFDLMNKRYHIFIAHGELENNKGSKFHHDLKTRSSEPVNLALVGNLESKDMTYLIRVHGTFMVISWLGTVSIAIILARYFKDAWNNKLLCGVKVWFAFHRGLMLLSITLMIIAQICIFYYVGGYRLGWHQITGSIAFTFALIQPIGALFRPHPDAGNRWLFNWLHWFGGTFGHILATAAILLTSRFKLLNLPQSFLYIVLAWIISHVIHHLLFQFVSFCSFGSRTADIALHDMHDGEPMYIDKIPRKSNNGCKYLFLTTYVFIVLILVTLLSLMIIDQKLISEKIPFL